MSDLVIYIFNFIVEPVYTKLQCLMLDAIHEMLELIVDIVKVSKMNIRFIIADFSFRIQCRNLHVTIQLHVFQEIIGVIRNRVERINCHTPLSKGVCFPVQLRYLRLSAFCEVRLQNLLESWKRYAEFSRRTHC